MKSFVVVSGCSGGGKSSLLTELQLRGYSTVEEPGRRIVVEEMQNGGNALPWVDVEAFLKRAVKMALQDRLAATGLTGPVFFDRGLIDAVAGLERLTGLSLWHQYRDERYHRIVFLAPPWPEVYVNDVARRHDINAAISEYESLLVAFDKLGYEPRILPKVSIAERADFVLRTLDLAK